MKPVENNFAVGICVTDGPFYDGPLGNQNRLWEKAGVAAIEMEASVLFVIASLRGKKAGAILTTDNYIFQREIEGEYKPHREVVIEGTKKMCKYVLDALIKVPV